MRQLFTSTDLPKLTVFKGVLPFILSVLFGVLLVLSFRQATANIFDSTRPENEVVSKFDTTFTYQGQLNQEGTAATGIYDFVFRLYTSGSGTNQVGSSFPVNNVHVADGLFTVQLDFGSGVFTGEPRWLEISVAVDGEEPSPLSPLQLLTAVPYAIYGEDADADPANELQTFIISGTEVSLSDGGGSFNLIPGEKGDKGERGETGPPPDLNMEVGQTAIPTQTIINGITKVFTTPILFQTIFETPPIVTISPVTQHPNNIRLSLGEITTDGFTLYGSVSEPLASALTLDNTMNAGQSASMKIINGKPAISYVDIAQTSLKYIYALNNEGTVWSNPVTIDNSIGNFRIHTSLALINGKPAISYFDSTLNKLKYVQATDLYGIEWGTPIELDDIGPTGHIMSLISVNNRPAISYFESVQNDLKYIRASDSDGSAWEPPVIVDGNGLVGTYSSMAIVNGNPAISYYNQGSSDLMFIRATDSNGGDWGNPQIIESEGLVGQFTSLMIVNGNPAISYAGLLNSSTHGDLKYIRATNANGTAWAPSITLHQGEQTGSHSSLAIINGKPAISYLQSEDDDLRFIQASDPNGEAWEPSILLDSEGHVGTYNSLISVNGQPAISYFKHISSTEGQLKYIRIPETPIHLGVNWVAIQP